MEIYYTLQRERTHKHTLYDFVINYCQTHYHCWLEAMYILVEMLSPGTSATSILSSDE